MHPIDIGRAAGGPRELGVRTEIASRATAPRGFTTSSPVPARSAICRRCCVLEARHNL